MTEDGSDVCMSGQADLLNDDGDKVMMEFCFPIGLSQSKDKFLSVHVDMCKAFSSIDLVSNRATITPFTEGPACLNMLRPGLQQLTDQTRASILSGEYGEESKVE